MSAVLECVSALPTDPPCEDERSLRCLIASLSVVDNHAHPAKLVPRRSQTPPCPARSAPTRTPSAVGSTVLSCSSELWCVPTSEAEVCQAARRCPSSCVVGLQASHCALLLALLLQVIEFRGAFSESDDVELLSHQLPSVGVSASLRLVRHSSVTRGPLACPLIPTLSHALFRPLTFHHSPLLACFPRTL
jgi:hypothetical protein